MRAAAVIVTLLVVLATGVLIGRHYAAGRYKITTTRHGLVLKLDTINGDVWRYTRGQWVKQAVAKDPYQGLGTQVDPLAQQIDSIKTP